MKRTETSSPAGPRWYYGWNMVAAGAASGFLVVAFGVSGISVFIQPLHSELGWPVRLIAIGASFRVVESGLLSPFAGVLIDRLGPRLMAIAGIAGLAAGLFLLSQVQSLAVYFLASILIALGQSLGGITAFSAALVAWFKKKRGRALGALLAGNGFGFIGASVVAFLVAGLGWRPALLAMGVMVLAAGLPLAMVIRSRPEAYGLLLDGEKPGRAEGERLSGEHSARGAADGPAPGAAGQPSRVPGDAPTGMELREALRVPTFFLLALGGSLGGAPFAAWTNFSIPYYQSVGFSTTTAALMFSIYGLFQVPLRFGMGALGDIFGRRRLYCASFACTAVGMVSAMFVTPATPWMLAPHYLFGCIGHAGAAGLGTAVTADYFGTKRFATIRGFNGLMSLPIAIAIPVFIGFIFDATGSYRPAFVTLAAMSLCGGVLVFLIRRPFWDALPENSGVQTGPPDAVAVGPVRADA